MSLIDNRAFSFYAYKTMNIHSNHFYIDFKNRHSPVTMSIFSSDQKIDFQIIHIIYIYRFNA